MRKRIFSRQRNATSRDQLIAANGSLVLDFLSQAYKMNLQSKNFSDLITFTRPSAATRVNPLGLIETVAAHVPCIDHSPVNLATGTGAQTLALTKDRTYAITAVGGTVAVAGAGVNVSQMGAASGVIQTPAGAGTVDVTFTPSGASALHVREVLGLSVWEQRTNYVRNSTMMGAAVGVIGSGGALPTNFGCSNGSGWTLSQQVVSTGIENGLNYIDLRLSGTPVAGQNWLALIVDSSWPTMPVSQGGAAFSCNMKLISGVTPTASANVNELNNGTNLGNISSPLFAVLDGTLKRYQAAVTSVTAGTTHFAQPRITFTPTVGVAFDFTVRIAALQIESGAFATPYISTSGAQVTRAADVPVINTLSPWFKATEGALIAEFDGVATGNCKVVNFNPIAVGSFLALANGNGVINGWYSNGLAVNGINAAGAVNKSIISYKGTNVTCSINGNAVGSSGASDFVGSSTSLALGSQGGANYLNGRIRWIKYLKNQPTVAQHQSLTA